jgi:hypothetical protein
MVDDEEQSLDILIIDIEGTIDIVPTFSNQWGVGSYVRNCHYTL